jgi:hypothetical protein
MTGVRGTQSAMPRRHGRAAAGGCGGAAAVALLALGALLSVATAASALVITGGPVYTLPGGGTCTVSGTAASASAGATWTCTGVNTSAHTHVYFGMKVNTDANGNTMTGAAPTGANVFSSVSGTTSSTITYGGSTTSVADQLNGTQTVTNSLILSIGGTNPGTTVSTGGTPAGNGNGVIGNVFSLPTGLASASFTVTAKINASAPTFANGAALTNYDNTHTPATGASDFSKVDLAFYYSDCGDGIIDSPEQCDDGVNNGTTCCSTACTFKTSANVCRPSGGACDIAENCTGTSAVCPANALQPASTVCRAAADECDAAENCTGTSAACPADARVSNGTPCSSDGNPCTVDQCDGSNVACQHPVGNMGAICRAAAGGCDVAETCTGSSSICPADTVEPAGTVCRAVAGVCDVAEECTGFSAACPADAFQPPSVVCRGSAGVCDVAESCTGSSAACPTDAKSTSQCRASAGVCDPAESCDGVGNDCPADAKSTAVCRPSAGACDLAESCDGSTDDCPSDVVKSSGTLCRAGSGDLCDPDEVCDGTAATCPSDVVASASTVCRAAVGGCDAAETCTGAAGQACPADAKRPNGATCRAAVDLCDVAETCDGTSDTCPTDTKQPDGTSCSDGLFCNGEETCSSGTCVPGTAPCAFCSESTDECLSSTCPSMPQSCRSAQKSLLVIKNTTPDLHDTLIWKWIKGESTNVADFANPRATGAYALCIYAGTAEALVEEIQIPPSATKWATLGTKGYKYLDPTLTADGTLKVVLKAGGAGKSKALLKGRGPNLPDPINTSALQTPVIAQLLNYGSGVCWEGQYTTAKKSTLALFKAKQ